MSAVSSSSLDHRLHQFDVPTAPDSALISCVNPHIHEIDAHPSHLLPPFSAVALVPLNIAVTDEGGLGQQVITALASRRAWRRRMVARGRTKPCFFFTVTPFTRRRCRVMPR